MITINYRGRYGNNLFQLSAANILSKKYNQPIISNIKSNILKVYEPKINICCPETVLINDKNFIMLYNDPKINYCNILLEGFFQQKPIINEFIKHNEYQTNQYYKNTTFIHIRLNDFVKNGMALDYGYYKSAIDRINTDQIMVATDNENHDIVKKILDKNNSILIKDNPENTILLGASCQNKILSFGTFSWWIGFLGNMLHFENIGYTICPKMNRKHIFHGRIFPMFNWIEL